MPWQVAWQVPMNRAFGEVEHEMDRRQVFVRGTRFGDDDARVVACGTRPAVGSPAVGLDRRVGCDRAIKEAAEFRRRCRADNGQADATEAAPLLAKPLIVC